VISTSASFATVGTPFLGERYWRTRLEGRDYDKIKLRNGYLSNAPEMMVELRSVGHSRKGGKAYYAIRLGRILWIKRWPARLAAQFRDE
jgi:hypothetical protein